MPNYMKSIAREKSFVLTNIRALFLDLWTVQPLVTGTFMACGVQKIQTVCLDKENKDQKAVSVISASAESAWSKTE